MSDDWDEDKHPDDEELVETELEEDDDYIYEPVEAEIYRILPDEDSKNEGEILSPDFGNNVYAGMFGGAGEPEDEDGDGEPEEDSDDEEPDGDFEDKESEENLSEEESGEDYEEESEDDYEDEESEGDYEDEESEDDFEDEEYEEDYEDDSDEDYEDAEPAEERAEILEFVPAPEPVPEKKGFIKIHIRDIITCIVVVLILVSAVFAGLYMKRQAERREAGKLSKRGDRFYPPVEFATPGDAND